LADGLHPGPLEDGKGMEGKGRELKGKQGRERGEKAPLGYLSRAPRVPRYANECNPASPLLELACHARSHSVACHPSDATFPPSPHQSWFSI